MNPEELPAAAPEATEVLSEAIMLPDSKIGPGPSRDGLAAEAGVVGLLLLPLYDVYHMGELARLGVETWALGSTFCRVPKAMQHAGNL